jgi:hypothetical protein
MFQKSIYSRNFVFKLLKLITAFFYKNQIKKILIPAMGKDTIMLHVIHWALVVVT